MPPDDVKYKYCMKETKFYENERFEMIFFKFGENWLFNTIT